MLLGSCHANFFPHFGTPTDLSTMAHRPSVVIHILDTAAAFWVLPFQKGIVHFGKVTKGFPALQLTGKHRIALTCSLTPCLFQHSVSLFCSQQDPSRGFWSTRAACRGVGCASRLLKSPSKLPVSLCNPPARLAGINSGFGTDTARCSQPLAFTASLPAQ